MHILIIPSWYKKSYNSSGIFFKEQAEALAKQGHTVGVVSVQKIGIKEMIRHRTIEISKEVSNQNGVTTYHINYLAIPKLHASIIGRKIEFFLFSKLFESYIAKNSLPDIVHLHSFEKGDMAIWIKEKYHIPYIVTEHSSGFARNLYSDKDKLIAKNVFEQSDYNIAVSEEFCKLLKNKFSIDFDFIPNIVNIDLFDIKKTVKEKGTFDFINISFLNKNKNQKMLIEAFCKAFKGQENIRLIIVGSGQEYQNLNNLIEQLGLENQITLYGEADRNEVKILLQESSAFVLSSLYETFGVVIIEAMACGLPCISTKCGGPESIINDKRVGLVSATTEEDLSDTLVRLYENRQKFDAEYIRNYAIKHFAEKNICTKLENVYNKVLSRYKNI